MRVEARAHIMKADPRLGIHVNLTGHVLLRNLDQPPPCSPSPSYSENLRD